jgi:hypothetical protein
MSEFSVPDSPKHHLIEDVVSTAVELGFAVVQEVASEALIKKPGLSLKEFTKLLDQYIQKQREKSN